MTSTSSLYLNRLIAFQRLSILTFSEVENSGIILSSRVIPFVKLLLVLFGNVGRKNNERRRRFLRPPDDGMMS